ncbi:MAG: mannose-1-phosphate guanylyltransferase [Gemmatimonadetes bacterium]|nr:mannose-1-phosphate guanylyltransferase [Gemmatimonadota bacterium]
MSPAAHNSADPATWIVILAGGAGQRFWPLSTASRPKQLLALAGERPLLVETVERARPLVRPDQLWILTGSHLLPGIREALPDLKDENVRVEPVARGTGPALAWAAWQISRQDAAAVLVSLHADHVIEPAEDFHTVIRRAADVARRHQVLVTVAVEPSRPETGYGYIRPGALLEPEVSGTPSAYRVAAFVEKPEPDVAVDFVRRGYLWNSGLFAWPVALFLREMRERAVELADAWPFLEAGDTDRFFASSPTISVDEAVLERSPRVAAVRASFRWDDVGSWESVARLRPADEDGNVGIGECYLVESGGNVVYAGGEPAVLFGVHDLIVVRAGSVTLVAHRSRAPELKKLLERLPERLRHLDP